MAFTSSVVGRKILLWLMNCYNKEKQSIGEKEIYLESELLGSSAGSINF